MFTQNDRVRGAGGTGLLFARKFACAGRRRRRAVICGHWCWAGAAGSCEGKAGSGRGGGRPSVRGWWGRSGSSLHNRPLARVARSDKRAFGLSRRFDRSFARRVFGVALTGRLSCTTCGRMPVRLRTGCGRPFPIGCMRGNGGGVRCGKSAPTACSIVAGSTEIDFSI